MKPTQVALYVLACIAATALLIACVTPAQQSAAQDLAETVTASTKDGVVTEDEAKVIQAKMKAYTDAPGPDWTVIAGTAAGTVIAGLFGLRYMPNSAIIGKQEAAHLDKAAGIS